MAVKHYFLYHNSSFQKLGKVYELLPCVGKTEKKKKGLLCEKQTEMFA